MTLKEIVEAVQHITRENIIIDSSILEKAADQLSLTEVNAFAGTVCAKAEKYSIKVPLNRRVLNEITRREKEF